MRIISIANQKGGCGKTTTTINLAATLSENGKRTLLIDLDPQAHASLGLNLENNDSIYNVISRLSPRKLDVREIIKTIDKNFDIVPSNILVGTLEQELADEIGRETKLLEVIEKIKDDYDYILIDCPPSLGFLTINALRASDEICVPVETSRFSLQGVEHLSDIVKLIRERLNHLIEYKILITMFDSRLRHSFSMLDTIRNKFASQIYDTIIHVNVKLKEAAVIGKTVIHYDKYCRGSKDYYSLAKEIISNETKSVEPEEKEYSDCHPMSDKMQTLVKEESPDTRITTFVLDETEAQSVYVTGSFNDWSLDENCRMRQENNHWVVEIPLSTGTYKYQFIVDGRWREDPLNPRQERNSFGDINSLIEVKPDGEE